MARFIAASWPFAFRYVERSPPSEVGDRVTLACALDDPAHRGDHPRHHAHRPRDVTDGAASFIGFWLGQGSRWLRESGAEWQSGWSEWWPGAESNCRPQVFQTCALPTELPGRCSVAGTTGFEPAISGLTGRRELQASPRPRGPEAVHLGHPLRLRGLGEYRAAVPGFTVGSGGPPSPSGCPRRVGSVHRGDRRRGGPCRLARSPDATRPSRSPRRSRRGRTWSTR